VSGIRVLDDHTVEFRLKEPDQTFLNAIAMTFAYPLPRDHYESADVTPSLEPCGTGPFTLDPAEWERGVRAIFRRNPDYWNQPEPWVDEMVYLENLTRDVALMRFRNGDLDHVHHISPADYLFLRTAPAWEPYRAEAPKVNLWGIAMNTQMAPFDDVHVRRAVAFAVDRAGWSRARANRLMVTGQPIPRQLLGYDPSLRGAHVTDLERAREEMALAGYPVRRVGDRFVAEGFPEDVEYWIGEGDTGKQYGELAQSDLAQIGIHVRLKPVSFATWLEDTGRPNRARIFLNGWNMDFPDPSNFLDVLFHSRSIAEQNSTNRTFYSNPELDALLDRAKVEPDRERRRGMYREASRILVDDAPWAFMWSDLALEAWQPYVRGYRVNPVFSNDYRHVWLDLPKQRFARQRARAFESIAFALPVRSARRPSARGAR
jgi:ABC-type transport system substrate-binding protein